MKGHYDGFYIDPFTKLTTIILTKTSKSILTCLEYLIPLLKIVAIYISTENYLSYLHIVQYGFQVVNNA